MDKFMKYLKSIGIFCTGIAAIGLFVDETIRLIKHRRSKIHVKKKPPEDGYDDMDWDFPDEKEYCF